MGLVLLICCVLVGWMVLFCLRWHICFADAVACVGFGLMLFVIWFDY